MLVGRPFDIEPATVWDTVEGRVLDIGVGLGPSYKISPSERIAAVTVGPSNTADASPEFWKPSTS